MRDWGTWSRWIYGLAGLSFSCIQGAEPLTPGVQPNDVDADSTGAMTSLETSTGDATESASTTERDSDLDPDPDPDPRRPQRDDDDDSTATHPQEGCPSPWPSEWIYCQDFEDEDVVADDFDPFLTGAGWMAVDESTSHSGDRALRMSFPSAGHTWSGEAVLRFGDAMNPGARFADGEYFDEVWARIYFKTQDDWPGGGFGGLMSLEALSGENAARVALAGVQVTPAESVLVAQARTCISDGGLECTGTNDWQSDRFLAQTAGEQAVTQIGGEASWHCIVLHARFDRPGEMDGVFDVVLDGTDEATLSGLAFRGSWLDTGWNALRIQSFWPGGGAPQPVERYLDDITISRASLDCP